MLIRCSSPHAPAVPLERRERGRAGEKRGAIGPLLTADDVGEAIACAATDRSLESGATVVVGAPLDSVPRL